MHDIGDRLVTVANKYLEKDFGSAELNELFRFFALEMPLAHDEWVLVGTEAIDNGFEMMVFFKSERNFRQFSEIARASLGGTFISGTRIKRRSENNRDQMVHEFFELGYEYFASVTYVMNDNLARLRLHRLKTVVSRSEYIQNQKFLVDRDELRNFRRALQSKNFEKAKSQFENIQKSGNLSSTNLCFLEYQLWYAQGLHEKIWTDIRISEVIRSTRPRVVTEFLLESLWNVVISEIKFGDLQLISSEHMSNMRELLRSVNVPSSEQGRLCLAVVAASSNENLSDVFKESSLESSEYQTLKEIIETKSIPKRLLAASQKINVSNYDAEIRFNLENVQRLAQEYRDEGNIRALFKALDFAQAQGKFIDEISKYLVRCITDELVPEFAVEAIKRFEELNLDVSNWSKNLRIVYQKMKNMAQVFADEWLGLLKMPNQLLAENQKVIVESASSWSISIFGDSQFDQSFSEWLRRADPSIVKDELRDIIFDRLTNSQTGSKSLETIKKLRDPVLFGSVFVAVGAQKSSILDDIQKGESTCLEFKASLRSPINGDQPTKEVRRSLEFAVLKTIAAQLHNEEGGRLLIGVGDDGQILGLENDYKSSNNIVNRDGFERHLRQLILDKILGVVPGDVGIRFELLDDKEIAIVDCPASSSPRFVKEGNVEHFFVRDGNSTRSLTYSQMVEFLSKRGWAKKW